jgi:hypothetical protein
MQSEKNAAQAGGNSVSINLWYGREQQFGHAGTPQRFVNILGCVAGPDKISKLTFSLNGGMPIQTSVGPNKRRLQNNGDFNIDILVDDLKDGRNIVHIEAADEKGRSAAETVVINYTAGKYRDLPAVVDWSTASRISDVAQVVEGRWQLVDGGVRIMETGYDRSIVIGDMYWDDYEITVSMTIHSFDVTWHGTPESGHSAAGIVLRFIGHSNWDGSRPFWGYAPGGAAAWYTFIPEFLPPGTNDYRLAFMVGADRDIGFRGVDKKGKKMALGVPYMLKARVQSRERNTSLYFLKAWAADTPEPVEWDITTSGVKGELTHGAVLLLAHHADVTYGNVTVTPI